MREYIEYLTSGVLIWKRNLFSDSLTRPIIWANQDMHAKGLCFLLLLCLISGCEREDSMPNVVVSEEWTHFNTANSVLPSNQINSLAIDSKGVKWIGTANGLVRITGDTWTVFDENNAGLPSSFIQVLTVQENGTIWLGTNMGLARYDGKSWAVYTTQNSILPDNAIMSIAFDEGKQITWIGTAHGLVKIDSSNNWKLHDEFEDDLILSMAVGDAGTLWLGTFNHFAFRGSIRNLSNETWTTYHLDQMGYESTFPYALAIGENNELFAVLSGTSVRSIIRFTNSSWQEVTGPGDARGFKTILMEDDKIWVGGNQLYLFGNPQNSAITLPNNISGISALALDHNGAKWIGTFSEGILVINPAK